MWILCHQHSKQKTVIFSLFTLFTVELFSTLLPWAVCTHSCTSVWTQLEERKEGRTDHFGTFGFGFGFEFFYGNFVQTVWFLVDKKHWNYWNKASTLRKHTFLKASLPSLTMIIKKYVQKNLFKLHWHVGWYMPIRITVTGFSKLHTHTHTHVQ